MTNYMIPADIDTVELVAKAIARDRLHREADEGLYQTTGIRLSEASTIESSFERIFESLWSSQHPADITQKDSYRNDARAAIAAINLKLLTSVP